MLTRSFYLSIDPGLRNLAMVKFYKEDKENIFVVDRMAHEDLVKNDTSKTLTYGNMKNKGYHNAIFETREAVRSIKYGDMPFEEPDVAIIEQQKTGQMLGIQFAIGSVITENPDSKLTELVVVQPSAVSKHFKLPSKDRPAKKEATRALVDSWFGKPMYMSYDLCDCFLNFAYYIRKNKLIGKQKEIKFVMRNDLVNQEE